MHMGPQRSAPTGPSNTYHCYRQFESFLSPGWHPIQTDECHSFGRFPYPIFPSLVTRCNLYSSSMYCERPPNDEFVSRRYSSQAIRNRPELDDFPHRPRKRSYTPPSAVQRSSPPNPRPQNQHSSPSPLPVYQWVRLRETDYETGIRAGQLALVVSDDTLITVVPRTRLHGGSPSSQTDDPNTLAELRLDNGMDLPSMVKIAPQPSPQDLHLWERLATETNAKWLQAAYCTRQGAAFVPGCRVALPASWYGGRRRSGFIMEISGDGKAKVRVAISDAPLDPLQPNFVQLLQAPTREDDVVTFDMSSLRRHLFSGVPEPLVGDRIYVVRGPEKGTLGRVHSMDFGEDPLVTVKSEEHTQLQIPMSCMVRHFMERDVVKIVHGFHAGEVGTVIRTFPLTDTSRTGFEQLHSAIEVFPLVSKFGFAHGHDDQLDQKNPSHEEACIQWRVLTQHVVFWDGKESTWEDDKMCRSPTGYSRVLAQRVALWNEEPQSPRTARSPSSGYSPSSVSDTPEHLSPITQAPHLPPLSNVPVIGNDEGRWLCIPKLEGKRVDVVILPIRHGRVTNVQAEAVGRSGFIELDQPLTEASLKVPVNVYVDGLQKRIRLAPKWLAPMRSAMHQPIQPSQDVSIAHAAKGRVVIIGPDVRGSRSQLGEYASIIGGTGDVVLVQFEREWYEQVSQAHFHVQSVCRSTNVDGKQSKATRFY
ncbi:hypothetical protein C8F01DRAFT_1114897 [Mycena amicta]|nr:hypothetical protein C8F01DRAFT_1114897 [Mycena amicta]